MARKATTKATIRTNTIKDMKKIGTYKDEYLPLIDIYSEMREQYEKLTKEFETNKYKYSSFTAQGGEKKSPLVATLENLRKDILLYSDRLCLNPKSLQGDKVNQGQKKTSILADALNKLE